SDHPGRLDDEAGGSRLVEELDQALAVAVRHALECPEAEVTTNHGGGPQHLEPGRTERLEAAPDRLPHRVRKREATTFALGPDVELSLRCDQPSHLAGEERVPLRCRVQRVYQIRRRHRPHLRFYE